MKAINSFLVVDKIKEKPKPEKGLILTESQADDIRYLRGKVISVGDQIKGIKENDTVWYDKNAGHGIEFNSSYFYVIKHGDVVIVE
jgi:co-chaperonin GroES (HSP10)|tara:strand:+ start:224 stop:481 length:258 start_codon:yes stop_codon:yes gene_type:complete